VEVRRTKIAACLALVVGCSTVPEPAPTQAPAATFAADWTELSDFDALRTAYGEREDFIEVCEQDRPLREASSALEQADWQALLGQTDPWLARCPVDIDFQTLRAIALGELGRTGESQQQLRWRDGLVDSVMRSGDGRTPATAWKVISVGEEYAILRVFGMKHLRQSLTEDRRDKMEVELDGKPLTLYFDPAPHFPPHGKGFPGGTVGLRRGGRWARVSAGKLHVGRATSANGSRGSCQSSCVLPPERQAHDQRTNLAHAAEESSALP
jgi:hypothetical protein